MVDNDKVQKVKCRSFVNDKGTRVNLCHCKHGGIGETNSC
jgi:hypothetical protein